MSDNALEAIVAISVCLFVTVSLIALLYFGTKD